MIQENDKFCIPEDIQKMSLEEIRNEKEKLYKEIMRDITSEEQQSVQKYIEKISNPTGVNFYDFLDKEIETTPCDKCPNNIKNGGSGICHCILGQQAIY